MLPLKYQLKIKFLKVFFSVFFLFIFFSGTGVQSAAAGPRVLLLPLDITSHVLDVQNKLIATESFDVVDVININSESVPVLGTLQEYDVVMVWTDFRPPTSLGDLLADYVDAGGNLVLAAFAHHSPTGKITGRFEEADMYALLPGDDGRGTRDTLGEVFFPDHPIMSGVSTFDGGDQSFRATNTTAHDDATVIASWEDGIPLILTRVIGGARRVDLNFFPVSSDVNSLWWQTSTDGVKIMGNSLLYAAGVLVPVAGVLVNFPPTAIAFANPDPADAGATVGLDGDFSFDPDGDTLTYDWTVTAVDDPTTTSDPNPSTYGTLNENPASPLASFDVPTNAVNGTEVTVELAVTDTFPATSPPFQVVFTIQNLPPVVDAGSNAIIHVNDTHVLSGKVTDPEGQTFTDDWVKETSPGVFVSATELTDPSSPTTSFTPDPNTANNTVFTFFLEGRDGVFTVRDPMTITVRNLAPVVRAGPDVTINAGAKYKIPGSIADPEKQNVNFSWSPTTNLDSVGSLNPVFTAPDDTANNATFPIELTGTDGPNSPKADLTITVRNLRPTADAGADQTVQPNVLVTLNGSGSSDPEGLPLGFSWTPASDTEFLLSDDSAEKPTFTHDPVATDKTIDFIQVVTDSAGQFNSDTTMSVTIKNTFPAVSIAPLLNIPGGTDGTFVSTVVDPGGNVAAGIGGDGTYVWSQLSGPSALPAAEDRDNPTLVVPAPDLAEDAQATYLVEYTDEGTTGLTATDTVSTTFKATVPTCDPVKNVKLVMRVRGLVELELKAVDPDGGALTVTIDALPDGALLTPPSGTVLTSTAVVRLLFEPPGEGVKPAVVTFTDPDLNKCTINTAPDGQRFPPDGSFAATKCDKADAFLKLQGLDNNNVLQEIRGVATIFTAKFIDGQLDSSKTRLFLLNSECVGFDDPIPGPGDPPSEIEGFDIPIPGLDRGDPDEFCGELDGSGTNNNGCQTIVPPVDNNTLVTVEFDPIFGNVRTMCYDLARWDDNIPLNPNCNPFDGSFNPETAKDDECKYWCLTGTATGQCTGTPKSSTTDGTGYDCDGRIE